MTKALNERTRRARAELKALSARYDHGAVPDAIFAVIKRLETDLAWEEHRRECSQ